MAWLRRDDVEHDERRSAGRGRPNLDLEAGSSECPGDLTMDQPGAVTPSRPATTASCPAALPRKSWQTTRAPMLPVALRAIHKSLGPDPTILGKHSSACAQHGHFTSPTPYMLRWPATARARRPIRSVITRCPRRGPQTGAEAQLGRGDTPPGAGSASTGASMNAGPGHSCRLPPGPLSVGDCGTALGGFAQRCHGILTRRREVRGPMVQARPADHESS